MPRDINGTYTLPTNDSSPAAPRNVIRSSDFNELTGDYATALTDSLSRSGDGAMLANLDFGGFAAENATNIPALAANTMPVDNAGGTARETKTFPQVRNILDVPVYAATRTALKALDTTNDILAYLKEDGREGIFEWTAGNFSTQITADTQEGLYIKADAIASTAGAWVRIFDGAIKSSWFGILGNGSNETTVIQSMLDLAEQKEVDLVPGANYGLTAITIKPGTKLRAKGATFTKLAASTTYAITISEYVTFDEIVLSTPGAAPDRGATIIGDFVSGDVLQVVADAETDGFAIRIEGSTQLNGIRLGRLTTGNFSSQIQTFSVRRLWIDEIQMTTYVTGLYVQDAFRCHYGKVYAQGTHSSATGGPGNNGILLEAIANDYALDDVTFDDVTIKDSAEHAFRIGGSKIMRGVYVKSLKAFNTAALVGVSTGGAAFKALLNDTNPGRHQDIRVDSLYFEDTGTTMGLGNHSAIHVLRCQDVVIMNPIGRKRDKAWSCIQAIQINACIRVKVVNSDILDCNGVLCDFGVSALPVSLEGMSDVAIIGGVLHTLSTSFCVSMHGSGGISASLDAAFNNVSFLEKTKIMGGNTSIRYQDITGAGSYANMFMDIEYSQPNAVPSGGVWQAVPATLDSNLTVRLVSDIATPVSSRARDGSTWISTGDNTFRIRIAGTWRVQLTQEQSTYTPVGTTVTNLDAVTPALAQYTRLGNLVQVTGQVTFDATAGGTIVARLTLPIASAFTVAREASGTFDSADGTVHGSIVADTVNDQLSFSGNSSVTSARTCAFTATYVVV